MRQMDKILFPQTMVTTYGSGFPVAPNILLTASHTVQDYTLLGAGYEVLQHATHNMQHAT